MKYLTDAEVDQIRTALGSVRLKVGVLDAGAPERSYVGGKGSPIYIAQGVPSLDTWGTKHHVVFRFARVGKVTEGFLVECGPNGTTAEGWGSIAGIHLASREFQQKGLGCLWDPRGQTKLQAGDFNLAEVVIDPTYKWYRERGLHTMLFRSSSTSVLCTDKRTENGTFSYVPNYAALLLGPSKAEEEIEDLAETAGALSKVLQGTAKAKKAATAQVSPSPGQGKTRPVLMGMDSKGKPIFRDLSAEQEVLYLEEQHS